MLYNNRVRDLRIELERHVSRRHMKGCGPPEDAGPGMMTTSDLTSYIGCNVKTTYKFLQGVPRIRSGKHIYYHIRDVATRLAQLEMEAAS